MDQKLSGIPKRRQMVKLEERNYCLKCEPERTALKGRGGFEGASSLETGDGGGRNSQGNGWDVR